MRRPMAPHNNCSRAAAWLLIASATGRLPVKAQRAPKPPAGEGTSADDSEEGGAPCVDLDAPCDLLKLDMYRGNCATAYMVVGGARLGADEACCACSAAGASRPLRADANASCVLGQTGVLRRQAGEPAGKAEQQEEWAGVAPEFFDPGPPRPLSERTDNHYGEGVLPGYVFVDSQANWRAGGKAARADKWHGAAAQDIHLVAKALEGRAALGAGPDGGIVTPVPTVTTIGNPVV
eukprot:COSAG04_NODE_847_length_9903_cov_17.092411_7_plen_234_part_01